LDKGFATTRKLFVSAEISANKPNQSLNKCGIIQMPDNGIVSMQSRFSANETMERLLATLAERNLTVFTRVDHAAGAASVGLSLRTTELVIFGNPKGGTPLMQDQQSAVSREGYDFSLLEKPAKMMHGP
jgi:hypothetical protein